ncbi:MAG: Asp-tRNA(Asn)/Glu-tRNA(Gln) amidotransferase subunit GatA [Candidatus Paceibacterota bacterium]
MSNTDFSKLTIVTAHELLVSGKLTAVELAKYYLANIEKKNEEVNAYLEVYDDVIAQAEVADARIKSGKDVTVLTGIPIALKDNILVKGRRVTAASRVLEGYKATYDATAISKLKAQGVVFIGRTNMDEFAMGGSTENSAFGVTKNPIDLTRVAGGSSGGSVAAVAMDGALAALGSDTGGSVRQPASYCGLVGMKPTYGSVSRYGLMAMGSSLDQIAPVTKTVADAEILWRAIAGQDPMDATTIPDQASLEVSKKLTIGVPEEFIQIDGIDSVVLQNFKTTLEKYKTLGYTVKTVSMPNLKYSLAVYYTIMPAEVSSNMARFDGVRFGLHKDGASLLEDYTKTRGEGFGREVRRRIILGTYILSSGYYDAYYNKANIVRSLIQKDYDNAFNDVDLIMTPTAPTPAFEIGKNTEDPLQMYLEDIFTVPINLAGVPAISIPTGYKEIGGKRLPIGMQLVAKHGQEDVLFKAGKDFLSELID